MSTHKKGHVMKLEDITIDALNKHDAEKKEIRLKNLAREAVMELGGELQIARTHANRLEAKAKIRAMNLHYQHGFTVEEIAQLLQLEKKEIRRWLK